MPATATERVKSHGIWKELETLGPLLDQAAAIELAPPASAIEGLARLKVVLEFTGRRLAATDAYLIQTNALDNLVAATQSMISDVRAFISDKEVSHIDSANLTADVALTRTDKRSAIIRGLGGA